MINGIFCSGKAGTGKTTVADTIVSLYDIPLKRYALADPIKQLDAELFLPVEGKPRWRYQALGQSLREIDEDVWIRALDNRISANYPTIGVIDDVRNTNEFNHYSAAGYISIRVECDYHLRLERLYRRDGTVDINALDHETETALDGVKHDYTIYNNYGLESLREQVLEILDDMRR